MQSPRPRETGDRLSEGRAARLCAALRRFAPLCAAADISMHILFICAAAPHTKSGYGLQGATIARALLAAGHTLTVYAHNLLQLREVWGLRPQPLAVFGMGPNAPLSAWAAAQPDAPAWFHRVTWLGLWDWAPFPHTIFTEDVNAALAAARADALLTLMDYFPMQPGPLHVPVLALQPLHFLPLETATRIPLASVDVCLGLSGHGVGVMRRAFGPAKRYGLVHHSRPLRTVFTPLPGAADPSPAGCATAAAAKAAVRTALGWPLDAFVVMLAGSNLELSKRKKFDKQLQAAVAFMHDCDAAAAADGVPRPTFLYIHSEAVSDAVDFGALLELLGEWPDRPQTATIQHDTRGRPVFKHARTHIANPGEPVRGGGRGQGTGTRVLPRWEICAPGAFTVMPDAAVADRLRAADVLLHATGTEGCGVMLLEAGGTGTPAIATASTAMPEMLSWGVLVPAAALDFHGAWGASMVEPSVPAIVAALHRLHRLRPAARAHAVAAALPRAVARFDDATAMSAWPVELARHADVLSPLAAAAAAGAAEADAWWAALTLRLCPPPAMPGANTESGAAEDQQRRRRMPWPLPPPNVMPTRWMQLVMFSRMRGWRARIADAVRLQTTLAVAVAAAAARAAWLRGVLTGLDAGTALYRANTDVGAAAAASDRPYTPCSTRS